MVNAGKHRFSVQPKSLLGCHTWVSIARVRTHVVGGVRGSSTDPKYQVDRCSRTLKTTGVPLVTL